MFTLVHTRQERAGSTGARQVGLAGEFAFIFIEGKLGKIGLHDVQGFRDWHQFVVREISEVFIHFHPSTQNLQCPSSTFLVHPDSPPYLRLCQLQFPNMCGQ